MGEQCALPHCVINLARWVADTGDVARQGESVVVGWWPAVPRRGTRGGCGPQTTGVCCVAADSDVGCLWVLLAVAHRSTARALVFVGVQGVGGDVAGERRGVDSHGYW